jgi:hypothetical protein
MALFMVVLDAASPSLFFGSTILEPGSPAPAERTAESDQDAV